MRPIHEMSRDELIHECWYWLPFIPGETEDRWLERRCYVLSMSIDHLRDSVARERRDQQQRREEYIDSLDASYDKERIRDHE